MEGVLALELESTLPPGLTVRGSNSQDRSLYNKGVDGGELFSCLQP